MGVPVAGRLGNRRVGVCHGAALLAVGGLLWAPGCADDMDGVAESDAGNAPVVSEGGGDPPVPRSGGGDGDGDGNGMGDGDGDGGRVGDGDGRGDGDSGDGDGDGDSGSVGDGGGDGSGTGDGDGDGDGASGHLGGCPAVLPGAQACSQEGRVCSYGDAAIAGCRDRAVCEQGAWAVELGGCASAAPATECPTEPPLTGGDCGPGKWCDYPGLGAACVCLATPGIGSGTTWLCEPPPLQSDACPPAAPNAGTACSAPDGTTCQYGASCQLGPAWVSASCGSDGLWTWITTFCQQTDDS